MRPAGSSVRMHHGLKRDDTGVHTVEGNVAGARAAKLTRAREEEQAAYDARKRQIQRDHASGVGRIDEKFDRTAMTADAAFQKKTVGLVTAADFRRLQAETAKLAPVAAEPAAPVPNPPPAPRPPAVTRAMLSFNEEEEDEKIDVEPAVATKRLKCPDVDTSFLPDRGRENSEAARRAALMAEWADLQSRVRQEPLELVVVYYDGTSHRRRLTVLKGDAVGDMIAAAHSALKTEFRDLRNVSKDALMYVKEDLIIPHHCTFYDLIISKARGKKTNKPLFQFDVAAHRRRLLQIFEGVNTAQNEASRPGDGDAWPDRDDARPGKIVLRSWYERNKHIFPADRWALYDPAASAPDDADIPTTGQ